MDKTDAIEWIFTPYITLKDGRRLYAKDYGKKAFRIPVTKSEGKRKK